MFRIDVSFHKANLSHGQLTEDRPAMVYSVQNSCRNVGPIVGLNLMDRSALTCHPANNEASQYAQLDSQSLVIYGLWQRCINVLVMFKAFVVERVEGTFFPNS